MKNASELRKEIDGRTILNLWVLFFLVGKIKELSQSQFRESTASNEIVFCTGGVCRGCDAFYTQPRGFIFFPSHTHMGKRRRKSKQEEEGAFSFAQESLFFLKRRLGS